jgi:hypothetical protein
LNLGRTVKYFRTAGWLVASGLAVVVGGSSYVTANEVRAPVAAYAVGFPPTGTARANYAMMIYGVRTLKNPKATPTKEEVALARSAYRAEPLSSTALSMIIPTMPEGKSRQSLLARTGELTRRNSLLNEEQIRTAALRGDDTAFFRWLSRSVLTNNDLRTAYVGAMADATAKEGAVVALTPVIGPAPRWSDFYWRQVIQRPASLINAAKLRVAISQAPWRQTEIGRSDQNLSVGLTNRAEFDAAHALYAGLGLARGDGSNNLLSNGGFEQQPKLPPFDWQLAVSGTLGSSIDAQDKSLVVSAIGGARGFAARQLVQLSPGNYRLGWSLSASMPIDRSTLLARVTCAEPGVKAVNPLPISLEKGKHVEPLAISDSACRWYWLSIDVRLPDDSSGVDAYFRNISLAPAGGEDVNIRSASAAKRTTSPAPN